MLWTFSHSSKTPKAYATNRTVFSFLFSHSNKNSWIICLIFLLHLSVVFKTQTLYIKPYISSAMLQERLVGLATISIKHAQTSSLDLAELVENLSKEKECKVRFWTVFLSAFIPLPNLVSGVMSVFNCALCC